MHQTHEARQDVQSSAERWHGGSRKEGPGRRRYAHGSRASISGDRLRLVAAPGGVAFVEDKPTAQMSRPRS